MVDVSTGSPTQQDAFARIRSFLQEYQLPESLAAWAWGEIQSGASADTVSLDLQARPEFQQAFPEIKARREAGLPPVSAAEIVQYRKEAATLLKSAGLPQGFYDQPEDFRNLISQDVSINELQSRIQDGYLAASQAPDEVKNQLRDLYGIDQGGLAAYYLDPTRALPTLQKQFAAAQVSGAGVRTGFGALGQNEAERLASLGVNEAQAQRGFEQLGQERELFNALPGEKADEISRQQQLAGQFGGDVAAQQAIRRRAEQRQSAFNAGGGFAAGKGGAAVGQARGA